MTDIEAIRCVSMRLFDAIPLEPDDEFPFIAHHPFTNTMHRVNPQGDIMDLSVPKNKECFRNLIQDAIFRSDLAGIYCMLSAPWKMTWFKFCNSDMDEKDYGEFLADAWISQDNPNQDAIVSREEAVELFKKANSIYLMDKREMEHYEALPDEITVWRGVGPGRERFGLSWTESQGQAEWFKHRFEREDKKGYMLKATIPKEAVLAYFDHETELVVDVFSIKDKIQEV